MSKNAKKDDIESLISSLKKEGVLTSAEDIEEIEKIPTGIYEVDEILGGGFARGRIVDLYGHPGSGKSAIALKFLANAQNYGICVFIDLENAFDIEKARSSGIETSKLVVATPESAEDTFELVRQFSQTPGCAAIVIDSMAGLSPAAELAGDVGDAHVGLVGRIVSQSMRLIKGDLQKNETVLVGINQVRDTIGCLGYAVPIIDANGDEKDIGVIVNQNQQLDVLTYDFDSQRIMSKPITATFNNGQAAESDWLALRYRTPGAGKRKRVACTKNHKVYSDGQWVAAEDLSVGDPVQVLADSYLSEQHLQIIKGSMLGDGSFALEDDTHFSVRWRPSQTESRKNYLEWQGKCFGDLFSSLRVAIDKDDNENQETLYEASIKVLPELNKYQSLIKSRDFSLDFFNEIGDLGLAVWYMDDGDLSKGSNPRISVRSLTVEARESARQFLQDKFGSVSLQGGERLYIHTKADDRFFRSIRRFIHPDCQYKLPLEHQGYWKDISSELSIDHKKILMDSEIVSIETWAPPSNSGDSIFKLHNNKYDVEVQDSHCFFANGLLVHNSMGYGPSTTATGGKAFKFYASTRLNVARISAIKQGDDVIGQTIQVKTDKSRLSPPFQKATFDLYYDFGISNESQILERALDTEIIRQSGAWFTNTLTGEKLAQGKVNAIKALIDDPETTKEIQEALDS